VNDGISSPFHPFRPERVQNVIRALPGLGRSPRRALLIDFAECVQVKSEKPMGNDAPIHPDLERYVRAGSKSCNGSTSGHPKIC
jgi:hypothetical protein